MKIKNIFKTGMLTLALSLSLTGCMNLDPMDSLGDNLVWDKAEKFQLFANQFYGWTRDFNSGSDYQHGLSDGVHSDYRSDLVCTSSMNEYSQGTNSVPATDGNYTALYKRIYYTNLLLQKAEDFGNKAAIAQPMGEALFFRAYLYFELVQIYGDAQLITEPIDMTSSALQGSRNNRVEVIDQCVADLEKAAELLPSTATEAGRVTSWAAWAMLSRVALYEGTWQKFHVGKGSNTEISRRLLDRAKTATQKIIEAQDNPYSLFYDNALANNFVSSNNQSYRYMFILEDAAQCNPAGLNKSANKEYILSRRHRDGDGLGLNITHAMAGNVCYVTRKMANMYLCSNGLPIDASKKENYSKMKTEFEKRDARMDNTLLYYGEQYWDNDTKDGSRLTWNADDLANCRTANTCVNSGYLTQKWAVERVVGDTYESMDYPVIRYAEVLLNFAEAIYELNDKISNHDLDKSLNLTRLRVNPEMPKLSNELVEANGLNMREEIRRERTVELFLEGFRIDDLKRWKTAEKEMPQDQLGVMYTGTEYESKWSTQTRPLKDGCILLYTDRKWAQKNYLYPLPSDQRQLNPNLGQNPGWE